MYEAVAQPAECLYYRAGLGAKQQEPAPPAADDHSAEQGEADGPTGEQRERRERPPRSARRERGQRERLPRPIAAAVIDSGKALAVLRRICFSVRQRAPASKTACSQQACKLWLECN